MKNRRLLSILWLEELIFELFLTNEHMHKFRHPINPCVYIQKHSSTLNKQYIYNKLVKINKIHKNMKTEKRNFVFFLSINKTETKVMVSSKMGKKTRRI